jgi:hypothetical protein
MKKQFGFSSVIVVMVVSDNSSALRSSFSPVSRDVYGDVVFPCIHTADHTFGKFDAGYPELSETGLSRR